MSALPILLRGAVSIAERLGVTPAAAQHMHREGSIPTFRVGGTPYATVGALDEWRALSRAGKLPVE